MSGQQTDDRPLKEIVRSVMAAITDGRIKGQLGRDLEKLCAAAATTKAYEDGK